MTAAEAINKVFGDFYMLENAISFSDFTLRHKVMSEMSEQAPRLARALQVAIEWLKRDAAENWEPTEAGIVLAEIDKIFDESQQGKNTL